MTVDDSEQDEAGRTADEDPGTGVVVAFGKQLKVLRERAGMDRHEFGKLVGYAAQSIASFEQGRRIPQPRLVEQSDKVLDAGGVLTALKEELLRAQYPPFFRGMAKLEAQARVLNVYAANAVPGLLQTEAYARTIFQMQRPILDDEVIDRHLEGRLARQQIFTRRPAPLVSFVIEEAVLRRPVGGVAILREQLEHLLVVGRQRNVEIQVMPTDREEHVGLSGPFTLIETVKGQRLAYTEVQDDGHLHTSGNKVRELDARYGILRAQAMSPSESLAFIEKLLGEK